MTEHTTSKRLSNLSRFVEESNMIEGIFRPPTEAELEATRLFIALRDTPTIAHLQMLVGSFGDVHSAGQLREFKGMDVRVGSHVAPRGGVLIKSELQSILDNALTNGPYNTHILYETLHPFMDGNGRSGRALWAWGMIRNGSDLALGFLHAFYYQTLQHNHD